MFASALSLGLALLPFVSAAIIDVQVGAAGKLLYDPEAVVSFFCVVKITGESEANVFSGCPTW